MTQQDLEKRLTDLEKKVDRLIRAKADNARKDWHNSIGMFAGDELMKEIDAAGKAIRERERRQARRRQTTKRRRAKP